MSDRSFFPSSDEWGTARLLGLEESDILTWRGKKVLEIGVGEGKAMR